MRLRICFALFFLLAAWPGQAQSLDHGSAFTAYEAAKANHDKAKASVDAETKKLEALQKEKRDLEAKIAANEKALNQFVGEKSALAIELTGIETRLTQLQGTISKKQAEIGAWQQRLAASKQALDAKTAAFKSTQDRIDPLQAKLAEANGKVLATESEISRQEDALRTASKQLEEQLAAHKELQSSLQAAQDSVAAFESTMAGLKVQAANLERSAAEAQAAAVAGAQELAALQSQLTLADAKIANVEERLRALANQISPLTREKERLAAEIGQDEASKEGYAAQVKQLEGEIASLQNQWEQAGRDLAGAEAEIAQGEQQVEQLQLGLGGGSSGVDALVLQARIEALEDQKAMAEEERRNLQGDQAGLKAELAGMQESLDHQLGLIGDFNNECKQIAAAYLGSVGTCANAVNVANSAIAALVGLGELSENDANRLAALRSIAKRLEDLNKISATAQKSLDALEAEYDRINNGIASLDQRIVAAQAGIDDLTRQLAEAEFQLAQIGPDETAQKEAIARLQAQIAAAREMAASLEQRQRGLRGLITAKVGEQEKAQASLEAFEKRLQEKMDQLTAVEAALSPLAGQSSDLAIELSKARSDRGALEEKIRTVAAAAQGKKDESTSLQGQLLSLNQRIAQAEAENRRIVDEVIPGLKKQLAEVQALVGTLQARQTTLKGQLEAARKLLPSQQAAVQQASSALTKLLEEVAPAQKELQALQAAHSRLEAEGVQLQKQSANLLTQVQSSQQRMTQIATRQTEISRQEAQISNSLTADRQYLSVTLTARITQQNSVLVQQKQQVTSLEIAKNTAFSNYQKILADFEKARNEAVAKARSLVAVAGAREGSERAATDSQKAGDVAGQRQGRADATKASYDHWYAKGYAAGHAEGSSVGGTQAEKIGREDGKRAAKTEAAYLGKRLGYAETFANSLQDGLKFAKDGDEIGGGAVKDGQDIALSVARSTALNSALIKEKVVSLFLADAAKVGGIDKENETRSSGGSVIPKDPATAQPPTVTAPAETAPAPAYKYLNLSSWKPADHPDIIQAYHAEGRRAYEEAFKKSFTTQYSVRYRAAFEGGWRKAYALGLTATNPAAEQAGNDAGFAAGFSEASFPSYWPAFEQGYSSVYSDEMEKAKVVGEKLGERDGFMAGFRRGLTGGGTYAQQVQKSYDAAYKPAQAKQDAAVEEEVMAFYELSTLHNPHLWITDVRPTDQNPTVGEAFFLALKVHNFGAVDAVAIEAVVTLPGGKVHTFDIGDIHGYSNLVPLPFDLGKFEHASASLRVQLLVNNEVAYEGNVTVKAEAKTVVEPPKPKNFTCGVAEGCNIRELPSVSAARIGHLAQGRSLPVLAEQKAEFKLWYQVQMADGRKGWIWSGL